MPGEKTTRFGMLLFLLFAFFMVAPKVTYSESNKVKIINQIKPAIVLIKAYMVDGGISQGSGFLVSNDGNVVTNWHVVERAANIIIKTADGAMYEVGEIVSFNKDKDLTKIRLDTTKTDFPFLSLSQKKPKIGEDIIVIGNPLGLEFSISDGLVSAVREIQGYGEIIQITAPISKGSSGSPVVNMDGQVIGVATLTIVKGQNLNFAIPTEAINSLEKYSDDNSIKEPPNIRNINHDVQLKENDAIKILGEEITIVKDFFDRDTIKVSVRFQFLRPCLATSQAQILLEKCSKEACSKDEEKLIAISVVLSLAVRASLEKGGSDAVDDTIDNMMDQWIDLSPDVTFTDFIDAVFMCDYHFKILCTFYTASGEELWTIEKYASAPFISSNKRKLDAIPGNKGSTFFVGPNEAKYWYVWVSK